MLRVGGSFVHAPRIQLPAACLGRSHKKEGVIPCDAHVGWNSLLESLVGSSIGSLACPMLPSMLFLLRPLLMIHVVAVLRAQNFIAALCCLLIPPSLSSISACISLLDPKAVLPWSLEPINFGQGLPACDRPI